MQTPGIDLFICAVAVNDDGRVEGRGIAGDGDPAAAARATACLATIGAPE
jgi:hypothetical protein